MGLLRRTSRVRSKLNLNNLATVRPKDRLVRLNITATALSRKRAEVLLQLDAYHVALGSKGWIVKKTGNEIAIKDFYYLEINGIKQNVYTYFSHGLNEYGSSLMSKLKKQLKFEETSKAEDFFDCPLSKEQYIKMLIDNGIIKMQN